MSIYLFILVFVRPACCCSCCCPPGIFWYLPFFFFFFFFLIPTTTYRLSLAAAERVICRQSQWHVHPINPVTCATSNNPTHTHKKEKKQVIFFGGREREKKKNEPKETENVVRLIGNPHPGFSGTRRYIWIGFPFGKISFLFFFFFWVLLLWLRFV